MKKSITTGLGIAAQVIGVLQFAIPAASPWSKVAAGAGLIIAGFIGIFAQDAAKKSE